MIDSSRFQRRTLARGAVAAAVGMLLLTAPASAQLTRVGQNPFLGPIPVRGTDTAFDPANNVFLVVGTTPAGEFNPLYGVFTNANGEPVAAPFQINDGGEHAHFPSVAYSPHVSNGAGGVGGFLVTWHGGLWTTAVRARAVAYPNRVVSPQANFSGQTWQEAAPAVAYSAVSQVFLVTWQASNFSVVGSIISATGQIGAPFLISQSGLGARDPSVAWNSATNEFGVLFSGFGDSGATTTIARVNPGGTILRRNTFNVVAATYLTGVVFNSSTSRFLAVWSQGATYGAEIDGQGDVLAQGLISTTTGTYDGLGVAYNPVSGTALLVGQGPSYNIWAAELNKNGARTSSDVEVSSTNLPSFHPRANTSTLAADWDVSFASNNGRMHNQVVRTSSRSGGPAGSLGPAPPPSGGGGSGTGGCPGTAPFPGAVCVNGGWVPGDGGSGGSGTGGCPGTAPFPGAVCVNGGWVAGDSGSGSGGSTGGCPGTAPFPGAVCVNGGWVPGDGSGGSTGGNTGGCPGTAPFPGAVCVNGGWVPGDGSGGSGGSTGGCPGTAPFPGAVCVNGGWVPGDGSGGSGGSTGGCPGTAPFPGAVCVNGGWVPGDSGGGGSTSCPGTAPFPGAVCVNGGWVPGTSGGTTGGCTTPDPFATIGGGTCINGGWVFGTPSVADDFGASEPAFTVAAQWHRQERPITADADGRGAALPAGSARATVA